jgi:hypothetical protein
MTSTLIQFGLLAAVHQTPTNFPEGVLGLPAVRDSAGRAFSIPISGADRATVLLFVLPECPIANRYAPEIKRIEGEYAKRGFVFWRVYPVPLEELEAVRKHGEDYKYGFTAVLDPDKSLAKKLGMRITPEVAVIGPDGTLRYRGRIDNLNVEHGKIRPNYRRDLRIALDEILAGKPVTKRSTAAVGCFIGN